MTYFYSSEGMAPSPPPRLQSGTILYGDSKILELYIPMMCRAVMGRRPRHAAGRHALGSAQVGRDVGGRDGRVGLRSFQTLHHGDGFLF